MWRHYLSSTARGIFSHRLLLIAWATVYGNTLRLARASRVRALRYE